MSALSLATANSISIRNYIISERIKILKAKKYYKVPIKIKVYKRYTRNKK
jgi:hypothetical protein